jgi:hypothetical protein
VGKNTERERQGEVLVKRVDGLRKRERERERGREGERKRERRGDAGDK